MKMIAYAYYYGCTAPEILFTDKWKECEDKEFITQVKKHGMNCEGGGVPGLWCSGYPGCKFGKELDEFEYEDAN